MPPFRRGICAATVGETHTLVSSSCFMLFHKLAASAQVALSLLKADTCHVKLTTCLQSHVRSSSTSSYACSSSQPGQCWLLRGPKLHQHGCAQLLTEPIRTCTMHHVLHSSSKPLETALVSGPTRAATALNRLPHCSHVLQPWNRHSRGLAQRLWQRLDCSDPAVSSCRCRLWHGHARANA